MALQTSGPISLNEIHIEAGGTTGTNSSINDSDIRDLINKSSATTMSFNEWYGAQRLYYGFDNTASNPAASPDDTSGWINSGGGTPMTATVVSGNLKIASFTGTDTPAQMHLIIPYTEAPIGSTMDYDFSYLTGSGYNSGLIRAVFFSKTTSVNAPDKFLDVYDVEGPGDKSGSFTVPSGAINGGIHLCVRLQNPAAEATFDRILLSPG